MQRLENGYFVALFRKVARTGQARGSRPNHRDPVSVTFGQRNLAVAVFVVPIGDEALQSADAYGLELDAKRALAFALRFLRADPAAHRGQRRALGNDGVSALEVALLYLGDKVGYGNIYGTAVYARLVFTV